jgi:hypothetical protein
LVSPTVFSTIPVQMPERPILIRLGYRESRTMLSSKAQAETTRIMHDGFEKCVPMGAWARLSIVSRNEKSVMLEDDTVLSSASLSTLLKESSAVAVMAATVGCEVVWAAENAVAAGKGVEAVIYDAVGGQTADAAMTWINEIIRQQLRRQREHLTKHRFSPGYGDLHLDTQRHIYRWLQLERLGLTLTSGCMLMPEKSVTALAGIEQTATIEETDET